MPTPHDLAHRPATAAERPAMRPAPSAPAIAGPVPFDRDTWEYLLRRSGMHHQAVRAGFALAPYAQPDGYLESTPCAGAVGAAARITEKRARRVLRLLEQHGWLTRPAPVAGSRLTRPITLQIPPAALAAAAARHGGEPIAAALGMTTMQLYQAHPR